MRIIFAIVFIVASYFAYEKMQGEKETDVTISEKFCPFYPENKAGFGRERFIAHAGGEIHSYTYTNSVEAVQNSIEKGFKFIEIDLSVTTDGQLVGAHDWKQFHEITGHPEMGNTPISLPEFKTRKVRGQYTPITSQEIEEIFSKNKDLILVTDKIRDFEKILTSFSFHDRIIVEIFSVEDYDRALKAGIKYPMLSASDVEFTNGIINNKNIPLIATHTSMLAKYPEELKSLKDKGGCIFVFSSSNEEFIKNAFHRGVATAFYTDYWDIKNEKCRIAASECTTY